MFSKGFFAKAAKIEKFEPRIRKEASRERLWFGPFTLPGVEVHELSKWSN